MNGAGLQSLLGILAVFALIGACAWIARRLHGAPVKSGGMIKLVGGAMVGARERVVVVEVNDTWIVLGVAPGRVNALHTLPRTAPEASLSAATLHQESTWPAFAAQLRKFMGRPSVERN